MKLIKTDQKNELIHSVRKGDHVGRNVSSAGWTVPPG